MTLGGRDGGGAMAGGNGVQRRAPVEAPPHAAVADDGGAISLTASRPGLASRGGFLRVAVPYVVAGILILTLTAYAAVNVGYYVFAAMMAGAGQKQTAAARRG